MNRIKHIVLLVSSLGFLFGCEKWIDPEININPDATLDATMNTILPALEASAAFKAAGGNDILRIQSIWLQQLDGVGGQSMAATNYYFTPSSVSSIWNDCYAEMLMDARMLKEKAIELGSPHNQGVANILTAFILGQMTDVWNDIPWEEALQGEGNFQAKFDTQESIYEENQTLLSEAITLLQSEDEPIGVQGDYLYDGNQDNWIKAAHALKARYSLHLSKKNGNQAYIDALNELPLAFADNSDDMQFSYGTQIIESNPLFQFVVIMGEVRMGAYFIDLLKSYDDPRIHVYAMPDGNGEYTGSEPGSGNVQASMPGVAVADPTAPSYFITYAELLFIKAESLFMTGQGESEVKEVLLEAVTASLEKNGVMDEAWLSDYTNMIDSLSGDGLYEEIMIQKYIATFYQPEVYHSWRRTGIPEIPPNQNGATSIIPRRYPYPTSEQINNPNTPAGIEITDRVWWDE